MENDRISNFEGETASNFLEDMSINGFGLIPMAIERMLDEDDRPTLMECEEALVACEIVAAALGRPSEDCPDDLNEWMGMFLPVGSEPYDIVCNLAEKAAESIDRILTDSELRELWEESPVFEAWMDAQVKLQERILD
ncbi:MAG: DUF4259 domain-containing protein [Bacteroidota bacterium]|jgi:hypothetical protein